MNIDKTFTRRIRIEGKPDEVHGYMMEVRDAETGEKINNIENIVVYLRASGYNQAHITYFVVGSNGDDILDDGVPVEGQVLIDHPEIVVTALDG